MPEIIRTQRLTRILVNRCIHYHNSQTEDVYLMRDGQRMSFEEAMAEMQESANGE